MRALSRGRRPCAALAAAAALAPTAALAEASPELTGGPLWPRDTAIIRPVGAGSIGIFAPLWQAVHPMVEIGTATLSTLALSPNFRSRLKLGAGGPWFAAAELGLGSTSPTEYLARGFLSPANVVTGEGPTVRLTPSMAFLGTFAQGDSAVTLKVEANFGVPVDGKPFAGPLGTYAPLELFFAPSSTGARGYLRLLFDHRVASWLRLRVGAALDVIGQASTGGSPWMTSLELQAEVALTKGARLALGAQYWNYDQRKKDLVKGQTCYQDACWDTVRSVHVRSNDVFPTLDFIWTWPVDQRRTPPKDATPKP